MTEDYEQELVKDKTEIEQNTDENDSCSICLRKYDRDLFILKDGNDNHGFETESKCHHWFCIYCLKKYYNYRYYNCPLCREDISDLVLTYYGHISEYTLEYESDDEKEQNVCYVCRSEIIDNNSEDNRNINRNINEDDIFCCICEDHRGQNGNVIDGNDNHQFTNNSDCHHWFCVYCLDNFVDNNENNCPVCDGDIEDLLYCHVNYYNNNSDSENDEDNSNEEQADELDSNSER